MPVDLQEQRILALSVVTFKEAITAKACKTELL